MAFVRQEWGASGLEAVVDALPRSAAASVGQVREASWVELETIVCFLTTAKRLLAPTDPWFFRNEGRFAGIRERERGVRAMVHDPETAMRLAATTWRTFYDEGRLEPLPQGPRHARARLHDFPTPYQGYCERRCAMWAEMLSGPGLRAHVHETACRGRGAEYCEYDVTWEPVEAD
jgi:hypothetical protein